MKIAMVVEPADQGWASMVTGDPVEAVTAHVLGLSGALSARGHDVAVHVRLADGTQADRLPTAPGVVLSRLPTGPAGSLRDEEDRLRVVAELSPRLAEAWARESPDLIHAHGWQAGLATLAAVNLLPDRSTRPVVVQTFHGLAPGRGADGGAPRSRSTASPSRRRLEAVIARGVDRLVALSAAEVDHLATLGASRLAVDVVPSGVDPGTYPPARAGAGFRVPARLLVVSGLAVEERVDTAVRALRAVPAAELLVVGGPSADRLEHHLDARRLLDLARRCRVADRVRLLGAVPRCDLPSLLRATDVLVRTDPHDPSGRHVLEAMAAGRPVIGPAAGCLLDAIVEGTTGTLVPPGDPGALAVALRELLGDPVRLEGFGLAAARRARLRYHWGRVAEETERAYAGTVVRRSATAAADPALRARAGGAVPTG